MATSVLPEPLARLWRYPTARFEFDVPLALPGGRGLAFEAGRDLAVPAGTQPITIGGERVRQQLFARRGNFVRNLAIEFPAAGVPQLFVGEWDLVAAVFPYLCTEAPAVSFGPDAVFSLETGVFGWEIAAVPAQGKRRKLGEGAVARVSGEVIVGSFRTDSVFSIGYRGPNGENSGIIYDYSAGEIWPAL